MRTYGASVTPSGSVLSQVLLHQSIIGLETKAALDKYNVVPDIITGCAGGGSNLGGLISQFAGEFATVESILPAPESSHAIKVALDEAKKCKETGEEKTIVFGFTGTGYFDMYAYERYNEGKMEDYIPSDEELQKGFDSLPKFKPKL